MALVRDSAPPFSGTLHAFWSKRADRMGQILHGSAHDDRGGASSNTEQSREPESAFQTVRDQSEDRRSRHEVRVESLFS